MTWIFWLFFIPCFLISLAGETALEKIIYIVTTIVVSVALCFFVLVTAACCKVGFIGGIFILFLGMGTFGGFIAIVKGNPVLSFMGCWAFILYCVGYTLI